MKKFFTGFIVFLLFISSLGGVVFADLPFAVTAEKVVVEGIIEGNGGRGVVENGEIVDNDEPYDGMVEVQLGGTHYTLTFWNVGALKRDSARFFKTDYSNATLVLSRGTTKAKRWNKADPGMLGEMFESAKDNFYQFEEISPPKIKGMSQTYHLTFSGGPYGTFTEKKPYVDKKYPINGKILENGKKVSFTINGTSTSSSNLDFPRTIPGSPFSAWDIGKYNTDEEKPYPDCKDSGIRFNDYDGEVSIRPHFDEEAWYGAELDMVLCVDDHVKTGDDSTCVLALADMTSFKMKPDSEIILSEPGKESKLRLIAGKVWMNVKRMVKDGSMDVEMSEAVAGIKGTTFIVEETGNTSTLKVIEGKVKFTSKVTGKSKMVKTGEMITATKEGLQEKQVWDPNNNEDKTWEDIIPDGKSVLIASANLPKSREEALAHGKTGGQKISQNPSSSPNTPKNTNNTIQKSGNHRTLAQWIFLTLLIGGGIYRWKKKE